MDKLTDSNNQPKLMKVTKKKRITPQDAARAAAEYYVALTGDTQGVNIEEIELSEDGSKWNLTVSHRNPDANNNLFYPTTVIGGASSPRLYKAFVIDAYNKEILAMKIKTLA